MAYDASRENQIDFGSIEKNSRGDYIKVQRIEPINSNKLPSIDIRNMYTSESGEIYPAKQGGIRVNSELVVPLMSLIYKAMSEEERIDFKDAIENEEEESSDFLKGIINKALGSE